MKLNSMRRLLNRGGPGAEGGELRDPRNNPDPFEDDAGGSGVELTGAPACKLATERSDPTLVAPVCPPNTQAVLDTEKSLYNCLANCATLNNATLGLRFRPSRAGVLCLPTCTANETEAGTTNDTVTCITCPAGFEYIAAKSACFLKCDNTTGLSETFNTTSPPRCAAPCPRKFPRSKSVGECAAPNGTTTTRKSVVRRSIAPRRQKRAGRRRPMRPRADCPEGATPLVDEAGNNQCYTCPDGQYLTQDADGAAICTAASCSDGYTLIDTYCWHASLGEPDPASATALFDIVGSDLPDCTAAETGTGNGSGTDGTTDDGTTDDGTGGDGTVDDGTQT